MAMKKPSDVLTKEEVKQFLRLPDRHSRLGLRDYAMLLMLYRTGARSAELAGLTKGDLDTSGKTLKVRLFGKAKKWRTVPVKDPKVLNSLRAYWKKIGYKPADEDPVFLTNRITGHLAANGIIGEYVGFMIRRYVGELGLSKNITAHSWRHAFATHMLAGGTDIKTVSELLGHSSVAVTGKYLHSSDEQMEKAAERFAKDFG